MIAARSDAGQGRLRMAIPKGSLFEDSLAILTEAGVDVSPLRDHGRQLMVDTDDFSFIIARPTDIPAYVAYGAVDVAIAGKDTLEEEGLDVVELVDLRFGGCRFVVAEPEDAVGTAEEAYRHLGVVRVATKYPNVTERHFAERGIQVEVVKLHGNIELAPLIGLADRIVDITATGRTLAENHLRIVEDVLESTARLVANPVSATLYDDRISDLALRLADAAARRGE
jgi:ATP phosphoribosyltransferase regulatory subunit